MPFAPEGGGDLGKPVMEPDMNTDAQATAAPEIDGKDLKDGEI